MGIPKTEAKRHTNPSGLGIDRSRYANIGMTEFTEERSIPKPSVFAYFFGNEKSKKFKLEAQHLNSQTILKQNNPHGHPQNRVQSIISPVEIIPNHFPLGFPDHADKAFQ